MVKAVNVWPQRIKNNLCAAILLLILLESCVEVMLVMKQSD